MCLYLILMAWTAAQALPTAESPPCRKSPLLASLVSRNATGQLEQILVAFGGKGWAWQPNKGKGKGNGKGGKAFTKQVEMLSDMWRFDLSTRKWHQMPGEEGPEGRWKEGVTTALDDRKLVMFGGDTETSVRFSKNDLWVFTPSSDPNGGSWQKVMTKDTPVARRGLVMATNESHLVIFGGKARHKLAMESWGSLPLGYGDDVAHPQEGEKCLIDLWAIPKTEALEWRPAAAQPRWRQGSPFPGGCRWGATGSTIHDQAGKKYLAMFGGRHLGADQAQHTTATSAYVYYNDVWLYDFEEDRWFLAPTIGQRPAPRDHHGAATIDNKLFIYGGRRSETRASTSTLADIWSFDIDTLRWTEHVPKEPTGFLHLLLGKKAPAPSARFMPGVSSVTFEGSQQLAVFAGETLPGSTKRTTLNDVWVFDPGKAKWQQLHATSCYERPKEIEEWELSSSAGDSQLQLAFGPAAGISFVLAASWVMMSLRSSYSNAPRPESEEQPYLRL